MPDTRDGVGKAGGWLRGRLAPNSNCHTGVPMPDERVARLIARDIDTWTRLDAVMLSWTETLFERRMAVGLLSMATGGSSLSPPSGTKVTNARLLRTELASASAEALIRSRAAATATK